MQIRIRQVRLNPLKRGCAKVRKTGEVSDRAWRYRANQKECLPSGPRQCSFCGSRQQVIVHHVDGDEHNAARRNLAWACRSCNTAIGAAHASEGRGRRTAQFNPRGGATSLAQWLTAVLSAKGESDQMPADVAREIIRETPPATRSRFAQQIWEIRRGRGTGSGVPF